MKKRILSMVLALTMVVTGSMSTSSVAKAEESKTAFGEVTAVKDGDTVTIGNDAISRTFSTADGKLVTTEIVNKRTDGGETVFTPGEGSEEFIVKMTKKDADTTINIETLDRSGWTAVADSYHNASGPSDGPGSNLLDGNTASIWHTNYGGGTGDQSYPYNVVITLGGEKAFKCFSYTPRQQGEDTNGNILGYELWVSDAADKLAVDAADWTKVAEGKFQYNGVNPIYVNLAEECSATQVKFVATSSKNGQSFAGGAEFNLHSEFAPVVVDDRSFASSALELTDVAISDTEATINNVAKTGKKVTFTFAPYTFKDVTYTITENIVMYEGDHFMRKYMEISVPDDQKELAEIDYIDLESFKVAEDLQQWTIPTDAGGVVSMSQFKANLGQPIYIQGMFFGCEFPATDTEIVDGTGYMRYYTGKNFDRLGQDNQLTEDGKYVTWQTVAGAARSTEQQVIQADFFEYIYSIATPSEFRIQYNSWFDNMMLIDDENILESFIEVDRQLNEAGTRPLDSYVIDDGWINYNDTHVVDADRAGTTLNKTGFWEFNSKFPNELYPSSELVHKFGSNFGLWVGPRGGYNFYGSLADIMTKSGKGSKAGGSVDVADREYVKNFTNMVESWQEKFDVNYWKWDGFVDGGQYGHFPAKDGVPGYANRHMTGGYEHMYHVTDLWEGWTDLMEAARRNADKEQIHKLWISLTCYVHPSPWFLQWANSVWMQCVYDQKDAGFGTTKLNKQLTYRDAMYYDFIVNHEFQFPLANVYNHDPIYGKEGTGMNINTATSEDFKNYFYMQSTRGTQFWELYLSDSIMTDEKYEVVAEYLAWAEANSHMLRNAKIYGGQPDNTLLSNGSSNEASAQAYGFACFDGKDGIISMRNPHSREAKTIEFTFDRNMGVSEDAKTLQYHLEHTYNLTDGTAATGTLEYGKTYSFTLQPNEVRILSVSEAGDQTAPEMVAAYAKGADEIVVKFNEKVTGNLFTLSAGSIKKIEKSADDVTYHIYLSKAPADGQVTVTASGIKDLAGNQLEDKTISFDYNKDNKVSAAKGLDSHYGFTVAAEVANAAEGALVNQGEQYALGIDNEGKAYFTLGDATAVSKEEVEAGAVIVGAKENNGILKLYVDGELVGSAYDKENAAKAVTAEAITVSENAAKAQVYDIAYGYDVVAELDLEGEVEEEVTNKKIATEGMTVTVSGTSESSAGENPDADKIAEELFDNDATTYWASQTVTNVADGDAWLQIDLGEKYTLNQVDYTPRFYDASTNYWCCTGNITKLVVEVSEDGQSWKEVTPEGGVDLSDKVKKENNLDWYPHAVTFDAVEAQYVRIRANSTYHWQEANENTVMTVGDLAIYEVEVKETPEVPPTPEKVEVNLALDKEVTGKWTADGTDVAVNNDRPLSNIVNGTFNSTNDYGEFGHDNKPDSAYIQVDLGKVNEITKLKMYRYWGDGRTYKGTVVAVSETADFENATIIYNSDAENKHGLGAGSDAKYAESADGKEFPVTNEAGVINARYVRVYMYGAGGNTNHVVELQVFGYESPEVEVETGDVSALIEAIAALEDEDIDFTKYTAESVAAFNAVIARAYNMLNNGATQEEIDAMVAELATAKDLLVVGADYTAVNAAKAAAAALDRSLYTADSLAAVDAAVAAVVEGKLVEEQAAVDAMAKAIEDAIDALVLLSETDADYTAVNAAKAAVAALDRSVYTEDSLAAVDAAVAAVVEGKKADEQAAVNAMAKAIEDAIAALEMKKADYTAVDEAIASVPEDLSKYTEETAKAVTDAVAAVKRDLDITKQEEVDAFAKAITDAVAALKNNLPAGVYTITYELDGGENSKKNPATYTKKKTITLKNPTKAGYTFKGWYKNAEFSGKKVTKISKGSTGDRTLYAKWSENTYKISYKLNGGKNNAENPKSYKVTTATVELQNPTRKGYTFVGWYSNKKLTKQVTEIAEGSTGSKTLYAKWKKDTYQITYVLDGGINSKKNPASYKVTSKTIKLNKPTKDGYVFKGWYKDAEYSQKVTQIKKGSAGEVTLYAKWEAKAN